MFTGKTTWHLSREWFYITSKTIFSRETACTSFGFICRGGQAVRAIWWFSFAPHPGQKHDISCPYKNLQENPNENRCSDCIRAPAKLIASNQGNMAIWRSLLAAAQAIAPSAPAKPFALL
jgi:hypothetical protein